MKHKRLLIVLAILVAVGLLNYWVYRQATGLRTVELPGGPQGPVQAPEPRGTGVRDLDWRLFKNTKVSEDYKRATFPEELRKLAGTRVRVGGSVFLLAGGGSEGKISKMALMPPELLGCCGPACLPRLEWILYVDCSKSPWVRSGSEPALARVEGTLLLRDEKSHGCLFTLADAKVASMPVPDFMTDVDYLKPPKGGYDPEEDRKLLRETEAARRGGRRVRVSSRTAVGAARRFFSSVDLRGKAKPEILKLLGDPATLNDFGVKPGAPADSPLIYRFEAAEGGLQYTLVFTAGRVARVTVTSW
jgi:hypothetical protein